MSARIVHRRGLTDSAVCGTRGINVSLSDSGCCVTCEKCIAAEAPMSPAEVADYYTRELEKFRAREAQREQGATQ